MIRARVVRIREPGGVDVLELGELEVRDPGPGELRVAVAAAGLNRADILQRRGRYPAPPGVPADVPGLEYAGEVEAVGEGVTDYRPGDNVMGIVGGGGMASQLVVHQREAMPVPGGVSLLEAAAIPEVFLTAYDALWTQGELGAGQLVLLHAVGSGVGTAALQLARLAGALTAGTSRSASKLERAAELGLQLGLHVGKPPAFAQALRERSGGRSADVILDTVGAAYLEQNLAALAPGGRLVMIGLLGGAQASRMPLGTLLQKRASLRGSVLRARPLEHRALLAQRFARDIVPLFERGRLQPIIDCRFPISEIAAAHRALEANATFGKIVLHW